MSDITPVEQLVAAEEKRQREHATLNAAPLSAITPETVDAALEAAEAAGLWERHERLNALKLRDLQSRMNPATGTILPRGEDNLRRSRPR
jgi:hypothetical protein